MKSLTIPEVALASASLVAWGLLGASVVAQADTCNDGAVKRGTSGGDYYLFQGGAWLQAVPTFDPNSADAWPEPAIATVMYPVPRPVQLSAVTRRQAAGCVRHTGWLTARNKTSAAVRVWLPKDERGFTMTTCHLHRVAQRRVIGTLAVALGAELIGIFALVAGIVPCASAYPASQYVRTESGKVRCDVQPGSVGCQYLPGFPQAPVDNWGGHPDIAMLTSGGAISWMEGNLATGGSADPQNDLILNYGQSYDVQGWTILPSSDGTRLTNDGSEHGMFVSIDNSYAF